jgi:peroxiredoxin
MKLQKSLLSIAIPIILLVWIWATRIPPSSLPSSAIEAPKENFLAPDFELKTIEGTTINLAELQGHPLILNFWASWCPPCRAEMPALQQAWLEYYDSGLLIIAVNVTHQDSRTDIEDFIVQNRLDFPIPLDIDGSVSAAYQIHLLPTTYIINQEGIITKKIIGGPIPLSLIRVQADQLLQGKHDVPTN